MRRCAGALRTVGGVKFCKVKNYFRLKEALFVFFHYLCPNNRCMPTYPFKKRDTMRRFRLFLFAVLLMLTASVQAQTLRDSSNRNIGKVESDGTIRDGSNRMVGRIYTDGTMRDSSNLRFSRDSKRGAFFRFLFSGCMRGARAGRCPRLWVSRRANSG